MALPTYGRPVLLFCVPGQLDMGRCSIMGHSMGGHGAITIGLKNAANFKSISAFAPIVNPTHPDCKWGNKALTGEEENSRRVG